MVRSTRMELHRRRILEALSDQGWRLQQSDKETGKTWAYEIWTIESTREPVGFEVLLTFYANSFANKKTDAWQGIEAVMASTDPAGERPEYGVKPVLENSTGQIFEAALVRFVMEVGALRDAAQP